MLIIPNKFKFEKHSQLIGLAIYRQPEDRDRERTSAEALNFKGCQPETVLPSPLRAAPQW